MSSIIRRRNADMGYSLSYCRATVTRAPKATPSCRSLGRELPLGEAVGPTFFWTPVCLPWPPRLPDQSFVLGRSGLLLVCQASRERPLCVADHQGGCDHALPGSAVNVS